MIDKASEWRRAKEYLDSEVLNPRAFRESISLVASSQFTNQELEGIGILIY